MEKMDLEIDDFMNYCEYRNLSKKTLLSYEQTLRLFSRYLIDIYKINRSEQVTQQIILNYINDTKERGKYTELQMRILRKQITRKIGGIMEKK